MNWTRPQPYTGTFNRRRFCAVTGVATLAALTGPRARSEKTVTNEDTKGAKMLTGNGEWTYEVVPGWGTLPAGKRTSPGTWL